MLYCTEIVARYSTERKSEIFGFAECEIIHFVNCEILLLRRNVKWNLPTFASANISHLRSKYFTAKLFHLPKRQISLKKAQRDCVRLFSWQGREDSNPRPTVLEWLRSVAKPWNCSLFRTFQRIFLTEPRVVIVSEKFWCFFDDIIKF